MRSHSPALRWLLAAAIVGSTLPVSRSCSSGSEHVSSIRSTEKTFPVRSLTGAGKTETFLISAGQTREYAANLSADQFLEVTVFQKGADVALSVRSPSGRTILEADSPNATWGRERACVVSWEPGTYRFILRSLDPPGSRGSVVVGTHSWRNATPHDRERAQGALDFAIAEELATSTRVGSKQSAIRRYEGLAAGWRSLKDPFLSELTLLRLGDLYNTLGSSFKAQATYERALGPDRGPGSEWRHRILNRLGLLHFKLGDKEKALDYYERALDGASQAEDPLGQAIADNNIGLLHKSTGNYKEALRFLNESLVQWRDLGVPSEEAVVLSNLGQLHSSMGEFETARDYFQQALDLMHLGSDLQGEAITLNNLGLLEARLGRDRQAKDLFQKSLAVMPGGENRIEEAGPSTTWDGSRAVNAISGLPRTITRELLRWPKSTETARGQRAH